MGINSDMVEMSEDESASVRKMIREKGLEATAAKLGIHHQTVLKLAAGCRLWRHVAEVVRNRMAKP